MNTVTTKVTSARELVEAERKRLLDYPKKEEFKEWLGDRTYPLDWMQARFGKTLTEKDGFTHADGSKFNDADCAVCNKEVEPDEKIIEITTEEGEKIYLCKACLKTLGGVI